MSTTVKSWEWSDFVAGNSEKIDDTLSYEDVSKMRVRDIKRRLARSHGYGPDELAKMIDKQELIHALALEEYKIRSVQREEMMRNLLIRTSLAAIAVAAIIWTWPIWTQLYDMISVNIVVYSDRKFFEMRRCRETSSIKGGMGIALMLVLDLLQMWLTVTVLLSWVMKPKWYFFPTPSVSIQPAQLMGGPIAKGPLGNYGVNVGPMLVTWLFRFLQGRLERFVGQALLQAQKRQHKEQRRQQRANETPEERSARKAAKRKRKQEKEEQQRQLQQQQQQQQRQYAYQYNGTAANAFMEPVQAETINNHNTKEPTQDQERDSPQRQRQPTPQERREAAARAAERRLASALESSSGLDDLD